MKLRERGKIGLQNEIGVAMKSACDMKTEKVYEDGKMQERECGGKILKQVVFLKYHEEARQW